MKRFAAFIVATTLHLAATVVSLKVAFAVGMGRFDSADPPTIVERVAAGLFGVLHFPVLPVWRALRLPGEALTGDLVFVLNSAVWGAIFVWLAARVAARRRVKPA